jgi:hypothetical protein
MSVCFTGKLVKTRKPHRCFGCAKTYPAASLLHYSSGVNEDGMWSTYFCQVCKDIWDAMHKEDPFAYESIFEGDLFSECPEEWLSVQARLASNCSKDENNRDS